MPFTPDILYSLSISSPSGVEKYLANPNAKTVDEDGNTLAHFAAKAVMEHDDLKNCGAVLAMLRNAGVDLNAVNKQGAAPVHLLVEEAVTCHYKPRLFDKALTMLKDAGADLTVKDQSARIAGLMAQGKVHGDEIKVLLKHGIDIGEKMQAALREGFSSHAKDNGATPSR